MQSQSLLSIDIPNIALEAIIFDSCKRCSHRNCNTLFYLIRIAYKFIESNFNFRTTPNILSCLIITVNNTDISSGHVSSTQNRKVLAKRKKLPTTAPCHQRLPKTKQFLPRIQWRLLYSQQTKCIFKQKILVKKGL